MSSRHGLEAIVVFKLFEICLGHSDCMITKRNMSFFGVRHSGFIKWYGPKSHFIFYAFVSKIQRAKRKNLNSNPIINYVKATVQFTVHQTVHQKNKQTEKKHPDLFN